MIGDPYAPEPRRLRLPVLPGKVWIPTLVILIVAWANGTLP